MNYASEDLIFSVASKIYDRQRKYIVDAKNKAVNEIKSEWETENEEILKNYGLELFGDENNRHYFQIRKLADQIVVTTSKGEYSFPKDATKDGEDLSELSSLFIAGYEQMVQEIDNSKEYKVYAQLELDRSRNVTNEEEKERVRKEQAAIKDLRVNRIKKMTKAMAKDFFEAANSKTDEEIARATEIFENLTEMTIDEKDNLHYKNKDGQEVVIKYDEKDAMYRAALKCYANYILGTSGKLRTTVFYEDLEEYQKAVFNLASKNKPVKVTGSQKINVHNKDKDNLKTAVSRQDKKEDLLNDASFQELVAAKKRLMNYKLSHEEKGGVISNFKTSLEERRYNKILKSVIKNSVKNPKGAISIFTTKNHNELLGEYNKQARNKSARAQQSWWSTKHQEALDKLVQEFLNPEIVEQEKTIEPELEEEQVKEEKSKEAPKSEEEISKLPEALEPELTNEQAKEEKSEEVQKNEEVVAKVPEVLEPEFEKEQVKEEPKEVTKENMSYQQQYENLRNIVCSEIYERNLADEELSAALRKYNISNDEYRHYRAAKQTAECRKIRAKRLGAKAAEAWKRESDMKMHEEVERVRKKYEEIQEMVNNIKKAPYSPKDALRYELEEALAQERQNGEGRRR